MRRSELARLVDHTVLRPDATGGEILQSCEEAVTLGCAAICVNGCRVALASRAVGESGVHVCGVAGFPLGAADSAVKALEAQRAVYDGAQEVDMVLNIGLIRDGAYAAAADDIRRVRDSIPAAVVLKVVLETALLRTGEVIEACKLAVASGVDFVKTSTGFGSVGGATVEAVALIRATVGDAVGVKAAGGIRTLAEALALVDAGASRLGLSSTARILSELPG